MVKNASKRKFKRVKTAFTLIEILAIIVVLAIIALISVPSINGYVQRAKEQSFKTSVESLIHAYQYKSIDEGDIGRVSPCSLDVNKCDLEGYVEKDENGKIAVYLTDETKCAIGVAGTYEIKAGDCTKEEAMPPVISDIIVSNITVSSATVYVNFIESDLITSIKFKLTDENGKVIHNWQNADTLDNSSNLKVGKKVYNNLEQGKVYNVEVEIINNAESNNTATSSKGFITASYSSPVITYSKTWEKQKTVTISYSNTDGVVNKHRTRTNSLFDLTGWQDVEGTTQTIIINNYHYYIDAKSTVGNTTLSTTSQIGYIDNEDDINNTKPSIEVLDYKNEQGINTNEISIKLSDALSGIGSYCVSTVNNSNNCNGNGTKKDLNKWVSVASHAEIREKTVQHEISDSGIYYVFLKDYVGNMSDAKTFTVYKIHYDLNGGNGTINDQIKVKGSSLAFNNIIPTKTDYLFLGWDTNPSSHVANYFSDIAYTSDSDITLYAIWRKEVAITYSSNTGTGVTPQKSICYRFNNEESCEITFAANPYSRVGYVFKGWSLGQNTAVLYDAESKYNIGESTTVYAGWKANELTFENQNFTKTFNTSIQTINIIGASNGNGNYTYSELSEQNSSEVSTNYITISNNGVITLSASIPVGTYTYIVRATSNISNNVDSYTTITKDATMTITINPYNISGSTIADITPVTYNGIEQTPTPAVTALGITLINNADYTYSYTNNKNAGTGTVTVTGKGNYTGSKSKNFTINRSTATNNSVTCATLTYNGANQSLIASTNISNSTVYYKVGTELTSSNYTTGSTTKPTAKDAGSYVVYYYAPADNYTETKGNVTCAINAKNVAVTWSNTSFTYDSASHVPTASVTTGISGETMSLTVTGTQTDAGSYTAEATCSSITTNNKCSNYALANTSTTFSISKINPTMSLSATSGTLYVGTNTSFTVSGSNYGTLSCTSSNTSYATCSVSGTTVTIIPKAAGSATITVTGAGNNNYNSISKTYTATIQLGYKCTSGTLTQDSTRGASSGGYICVTSGNGTRSCKNNNYRCNYDAYVLWGCDANYNYTQFNKPALTNQSAVTYSSVGNCPNGAWGCQNNVRTFSSNPGTSYGKILSTSDYEYGANVNYMSSSAGLVYYTQCTYVYSTGNETCSQSTATIANFESRQASLPSNNNIYAYMGYAGYVYQNEYYTVAIRYTCTITYGSSEAGRCAPVYRTGTVTCPDGEIVTYTCPSGWTAYNSDNSKCYRAATR